VFITNLHPSVLAKLGMRYEDVAHENARLIYARATGYGDEGGEVEKPGYDATAWWARSGLMDAVRPKGAEFAFATAGMGDHPSAVALFGAIALALFDRERTGKGRRVRVADGERRGRTRSSCKLRCAAARRTRHPRTESLNALVNATCVQTGAACISRWCRRRWSGSASPAPSARPSCATIRASRRFPRGAPTRRPWSRSSIRSSSRVRSRIGGQSSDRHTVTFGIIARVDDLPEDPQLNANGVFRPVVGPGVRPGLRTVDSPIHESDPPAKRDATRAPDLGEHGREIRVRFGYSSVRNDAPLCARASCARRGR
jgi:crotonobetainyl-CoA:carnitine CoA-transferase CaiB-like acyl-CoA transferase